MDNKIICSRCIYDSNVSGIFFDTQGVCNYCHQIDELVAKYHTGSEKGKIALDELLQLIKNSRKNKKYDCVIGVSGGTDSSYLLYKAKEWGLNPLAVHYDNTWNTAVATENIRKITSKLNVDLYTYVIDNKEADDIYRSFLKAGVPEFDASTDIGFAQVLRMAAAKHKIRYILEGHSFLAEGISPMGNNYFDGKYIISVHKKYGALKKFKTYPNLTFFQFLKWIIVYRQKFIRPLWYLNYSKREAQKILKEKLGWEYYGGHHLENRATTFLHTVYNPQKYRIDNRNWSLAAEVRSGVTSRKDALAIYNNPINTPEGIVDFVKKRLALNADEYEKLMNGTKRTFQDFNTYKKRFEKWRPFFYIMNKLNLVPTSFYVKYCFPSPAEK